MIYGQMEEETLQQTLQLCSTTKLSPNFFPYSPQDYVYFDDLIALKNKIENTHTQSLHPSPPTHAHEDTHAPLHFANEAYYASKPLPQTVDSKSSQNNQASLNIPQQSAIQAQNIFSDIAHDVSKGFHDVAHGIEAAGKAIGHAVVAAGEGVAGLGASIVGNVFDIKSVREWGSAEEQAAITQVQDASKDLQKSVTDFAQGLENGIVAPYAEIDGDLVGVITGDKQLGESITGIINKVDDSLINVAAAAINFTTQAYADYYVANMEVGAKFADLVASTALVVFTGTGTNEWLSDAKGLVHTTISSITESFKGLLAAGEKLLFTVMQSLGAIINSMTSLFIDISKEISYIVVLTFTGSTKDAAEARNKVSSKLNAHRSTINMVMGVAVSIAVDVATGGAATESDAAIMAAAETASEVAADAATSAAEAGAEAAAKEAAAQAAKQAAEEAAETAAKQGATQAEKEAAETAAKQAEQAAKEATEAQAKKEAAETAAKQAQEKAQQAAVKASQKAATNAAKQGLKNASTDAEKATAKQALKDATEDELKTASEDLAKAQAKKEAAKEALENATTSAEKKAAKKVLTQASNDVAKKELEEAAAKKAFSSAARDVAKDTLQQASKDAEEAAAKKVLAQEAKEQAEREIEEATTDEAKQLAKEKLEQATEELERATAEDAEKQAAKEAAEDALKQTTKDALKDTAKFMGKRAAKFLADKGISLLMNSAFGAFSIMSGLNSDNQNEFLELQQAAELRSLWRYINASKLSTTQTELANLEEVKAKQQAEVGNRTLALAFFKNIIYQKVNQFSTQLSGIMSQQYTQLLTPNAHNMLPGNIGTSWGLETNYLDLYPSEGYSTATKGRPDFPFAQEVAQAPFAALPHTPKTSDALTLHKTKTPTKLWFNQKVVALDLKNANNQPKQPTDPLNVTIDLQCIYTLNSGFYTGLYLGGNFSDYTSQKYLENLQTNKTIDLDAAHLAKMVVLFREKEDSPVSIGVYEHEGKGWILQEELPKSMQLSQVQTYHIQSSLDQSNLQISLWADDQTSRWSKTVTVTALANQRTYGVIASGIAIQWNQKTPLTTVEANDSARTPLNQPSEIEREKLSKKRIGTMLQPQKFGSIKLKPLSKQSILFGQYLYTTTDTNIALMTRNNNTDTDFVLFATYENGTLSNIGTASTPINNKTPQPNVIVSAITGNAYDTRGNIVAHATNVWNSYNKQYGPFDSRISDYIAAQRKIINENLAHIQFGSFNLDIINQQALAKGQFIYQCNQTLSTQSRLIPDYLITIELRNGSIGNMIGMPPTSANATGLVSLVTGKVYAKNTVLKPDQPAPSLTEEPELGAYQNQFGNIAPNDIGKIQASQAMYKAQVKAQQAAKRKVKVISFGSTSATNNIAAPISPSDGLTLRPSTGITLGPPSSGKISTLQKNAASPAGLQLTPPQQGIKLSL